MSQMGHLQALPRRNSNGRFTSISRHEPDVWCALQYMPLATKPR
jgi:hypothetical protein